MRMSLPKRQEQGTENAQDNASESMRTTTDYLHLIRSILRYLRDGTRHRIH